MAKKTGKKNGRMYQDDVGNAKLKKQDKGKKEKALGRGESEITSIVVKNELRLGGGEAWKLT